MIWDYQVCPLPRICSFFSMASTCFNISFWRASLSTDFLTCMAVEWSRFSIAFKNTLFICIDLHLLSQNNKAIINPKRPTTRKMMFRILAKNPCAVLSFLISSKMALTAVRAIESISGRRLLLKISSRKLRPNPSRSTWLTDLLIKDESESELLVSKRDNKTEFSFALFAEDDKSENDLLINIEMSLPAWLLTPAINNFIRLSVSTASKVSSAPVTNLFSTGAGSIVFNPLFRYSAPPFRLCFTSIPSK